jgi:DNA-binding CsgD family transcriptional regulator/tetratricopeptide (TPR) repeat protein
MEGVVAPLSAHSPLVGRAAALAKLAALLDDARHGRGSAVAVVGEAGIGKSRLVREARARTGAGATVLEGRCVALGGEPLRHAALLDLLRGAAQTRGAVAANLAGAATEALLERLLELVDAAPAGAPLILVIEDVQWADRATCEVVMVLARRVTGRPASLVLTCRNDELPRGHHVRLLLAELGQAELITTIALERLSPADVAQLIEHVAGSTDDVTAAAVFNRSAGNPLLVHELCLSGPDPAHMPMIDVLLARADRLSPAARQVAAVVAAAGTRVDGLALDDVLTALGSTDDAGLQEALDHRLLVRRGDEIEFDHVLVAEAVHHRLLPAERRRLHRQWAETLRATAAPDVLAHHWAEAGEHRRALVASVAAGDRAAADLAAHDASGHYRRALELWSKVDDAADAAGCSLVELSKRAAEATNRTGDRRAAIEILAAARRTLGPEPDPVTVSALAERTGWYLLRDGRAEEAEAAYAEAVRTLPDDAPAAVRAEVLAGSVRAAEHRRDADAALTRARAAMAASAGTNPREQGHAHYMLARALLVAGEWDEAEAELVAAALAAEVGHDPVTAAVALLDRADLVAESGRIGDVVGAADAAAARLRDGGWADPNATLIAGVAASIDLRRGRVAAARSRVVSILADSRTSVTLALGHVLAGWCDLEAAAHLTAREHLEMARFLAAPLLDGRLGGTLAIARAELAEAMDHLDHARTAVEEGLRLVATTGDDEMLGQIALFGMRIAQERSQRQDRRSAPGTMRAIERDLARYDDVAANVLDGRIGRPAYDALAAELVARRLDRDRRRDPDAWLASAEAWSAVEWPRLAVRARLSVAAACFESGDRTRGAGELATARATAEGMESALLVAEADRMAQRAGLAARPAASPSADASGVGRLTRRERDVLELVAAGSTNRQIAAALYISEKTASVHVSRILAKLGVTSRQEAAALARRQRRTPREL